MLTSKQASDLARRIKFTSDWPEQHPEVAAGLERIVGKQTRRVENKRLRARKVVFQSQLDQFVSRKAPGHDAAVKAIKVKPVGTLYDLGYPGVCETLFDREPDRHNPRNRR